jgi:hypothetical protein
MKIRTASMALLAGLTFAAPTAAFAGPTAPAAQIERVAAPTQAPLHATASYADREAQNQQVAEYEGGNTVVIGISGGALVVLLILLLLL